MEAIRNSTFHAALAVQLLATLALAGCKNTQATSTPQPPANTDVVNLQETSVTESDIEEPVMTGRAVQCPLTHQELGSQTASRIFADHQIDFRSEAEASSFDELPGEKKRVVAGRQVLARKGVANEYCIVTKRALPIDAVMLVDDDLKLGFVNENAKKQFESIPESVRIDLIAPYIVRSEGIANERCPVTNEVLYPGCPAIEVQGVLIGFESGNSVEVFKGMDSNKRSETAALVVLPSKGVTNDRCPVTGMPLRLDSPMVMVDGRMIGLRNISAAREFNGLELRERRALVRPDEL